MTHIPTVTAVPTNFDAAVVGAGPAGLACAVALALRGARIALVGRSGTPVPDLRTAALFPASVRLLENLNAWQGCARESAPLAAIRILDDTSWLLRAPETLFTAQEFGEPALATNITNATLVRQLGAAAGRAASLTLFETSGTPDYARTKDSVVIRLSNGRELTARLAVAADGRGSPLREFAGIAASSRSLDQTALVTSFAHSRPHANVSTEIHRDPGPLTTVPLSGNHSSLVWVERPREAERLSRLEPEAFLAELQRNLHGLLGQLAEIGPRMTFPLQWLDVDCHARNRIALVGEAAHVLPPIGAQGLNLGLRDVAELAGLVLPLIAAGGDPGTPSVLAAYDRDRKADTRVRSLTVDILNQSLESGALPLQLARGLGLFAMRVSPAFKRMVMRHGAGGLGLPPNLMRAPDMVRPAARHAAG